MFSVLKNVLVRNPLSVLVQVTEDVVADTLAVKWAREVEERRAAREAAKASAGRVGCRATRLIAF